MQIKEFEAYTLKDCLQLVRKQLGPDAVILETRKFRKGGLLGWGAKDAVRIIAATGIAVQDDAPGGRPATPQRPTEHAVVSAPSGGSSRHRDDQELALSQARPAASSTTAVAEPAAPKTRQASASVAARNAYARAGAAGTTGVKRPQTEEPAPVPHRAERDPLVSEDDISESAAALLSTMNKELSRSKAAKKENSTPTPTEAERLATLEKTMKEIRDTLTALKQEQRASEERTVTALVSAVTPVMNAAGIVTDTLSLSRFPELHQRLTAAGVSNELAEDLIDSLPDLSAWGEEARPALAESALRDLLSRRVPTSGGIALTPGQLKAVALIGPTGVGKTTTIAKLAAHFSLVENKRVALLTMDTYRIAAVEQLKIYSQIIDIPISVAYSPTELLTAMTPYADYDLLLIDTAGRSQHNIMQVGELKTMLENLSCETHLVLSAPVKEQDMLESIQKFSAARVDRLTFTKLDETSTYGALLNVADRTGIPLSYMTTGQKVPEDIETVDGSKIANLILN